MAFRKINQDVEGFILINPQQIQCAKVTVRHFLTKVTGPIAQPIMLRSSSDEDNLQETISKICKIIREKVADFARACRLITSIHPSKLIPWNSTLSEDWFTESLVQGSLLLHDLIRLGEKIWFTFDHYFDIYNVFLHENNVRLKKSYNNKICLKNI